MRFVSFTRGGVASSYGLLLPDDTGRDRRLAELEPTCHVNGEERQRGRVSRMIFDIPEIIAPLSAGLTPEPGDIIATGTPSGVGYTMDPPRYLTAGDVVTCEIGGVGVLHAPIISPALEAAA